MHNVSILHKVGIILSIAAEVDKELISG